MFPNADQADLIGFLQGLLEGRKRRGIRYPHWFLLLVAIMGINRFTAFGYLCHESNVLYEH